MTGDEFFTAAQVQRLGELMARWRKARDANTPLPANEQSELETLVEQELDAAMQRSKALLKRHES